MTIDNSGLIADVMLRTQPGIALSKDVDDSYRTWIKQSGARVALYRQYEQGDHRAGISPQMRAMLRLTVDDSGIVDFNDNYCSIVVDKMSSRLHVNEISLGEDTADKQWLSPLLEKNNWVALQGTLFRGAIRDGDSYVMVDPDTLEWTSEPAYDGYSGIFALFYNNSSTPYWACKLWSEAETPDQKASMRIIVYEENKISYWRGEEGGSEVTADNRFSVREAYSISKAIPVDAQPDSMVNFREWAPTATPIIHFVNKFDNYSDTGESEIRAAIPLQDVLNRTLHSMVMASEFSAFSVLWSKGIEIDVSSITPGAVVNLLLKDAHGVPIEPSPEATAFLQAVAVGQFQGSDIQQYTNQIDKIVRELSQATQTPIYGVTNQGAVSGEALRQLEIGLIGKCERFQRQNTDAVKSLIRITAEIQKTFSGSFETELPSPPEIKGVTVAWKSPEILDVTAQISTLFTMRRDTPGLWADSFYRTRIGGLLGMSQTAIEEEAQKAEAENENRLARMSGTDGSIPPV